MTLMVTLYVITMTLCLHSHYVWPSQWLCAPYNECKPPQWLCMASQWVVCLHDDLVPSMILCAFLKESVCPSQWLLCAILTLSVPHSDSGWAALWLLCNNLCALIVNLCLLTKPQRPPKDSIWPSHCIPSQCCVPLLWLGCPDVTSCDFHNDSLWSSERIVLSYNDTAWSLNEFLCLHNDFLWPTMTLCDLTLILCVLHSDSLWCPHGFVWPPQSQIVHS